MSHELTDRQHDDFKWYVGEMPDLYQRYGECHAVISNRTVLGTFGTAKEAYEYATSILDEGEFVIQKIGRDESAYTITMAPMLVVP